MKNKPNLNSTISFTEMNLAYLEGQYTKLAEDFTCMYKNGSALENIHALDTLRSMLHLYTNIAAHRDVLRSLKIKI